jgi:F-type H+-transporting ATPase subunit b
MTKAPWAVVLGLLLLTPVTAAAATAEWRPLYDTIMRWVNFGIMVALFLKYAKGPLVDFIRSKRGEVAAEIKRFEQEKNAALAKVAETEKALAQSQERLQGIRERIVAQGEERRQQIVDDARRESEIIMKSAQSKIEADFMHARQALKNEMVERAIELALERLPAKITPQDNQRWVDRYISATQVG